MKQVNRFILEESPVTHYIEWARKRWRKTEKLLDQFRLPCGMKWGKESGYFDITKQTVISNIAYKLRQNKILADEEYQKGVEILNIVVYKNEELLQETDPLFSWRHVTRIGKIKLVSLNNKYEPTDT